MWQVLAEMVAEMTEKGAGTNDHLPKFGWVEVVVGEELLGFFIEEVSWGLGFGESQS